MAFLKFYRIRGASMEPYARDNDYVFVRSFLRWEKPRKNDMIVALDPRDLSRVICKRIAGIENNRYIIVGDNADASTDSRMFGPIAPHMIRGKVIARFRA